MKLKLCLLIIPYLIIGCETVDKKESKPKEVVETVVEEVKVEVPKNQKLTSDQQITSAVLAAPKKAREGAKVYGYNDKNELVILREGTNNFICIADDPAKKGFQVVAYHTLLENIKSRGRELTGAGKSREEKEKIRAEEAKSGKLALPQSPATLHIYYGENGFFNTETNSIDNTKYRYVIYIPYATQETTGLNLKPNQSSHPWLMFPGKYNAHIMITPNE